MKKIEATSRSVVIIDFGVIFGVFWSCFGKQIYHKMGSGIDDFSVGFLDRLGGSKRGSDYPGTLQFWTTGRDKGRGKPPLLGLKGFFPNFPKP